MAALYGHTPVVEKLIAAGAVFDFHRVYRAARIALTFAAFKGQSLMTEQLIAAGADLNVKFNEGYGHRADCPRLLDKSTALILAAMNGHTLVVEQLIAAGAALDVQNNEGYARWADCDGLALSEPAS